MSSSFSGTLRARSVTTVSGRITSWQMATTSIIAESVQAGQKRPGPITLSMPTGAAIESGGRY